MHFPSSTLIWFGRRFCCVFFFFSFISIVVYYACVCSIDNNNNNINKGTWKVIFLLSVQCMCNVPLIVGQITEFMYFNTHQCTILSLFYYRLVHSIQVRIGKTHEYNVMWTNNILFFNIYLLCVIVANSQQKLCLNWNYWSMNV